MNRKSNLNKIEKKNNILEIKESR